VILQYYDNSILAKIIRSIVNGIIISYETSYINKIIKDKKDIYEESIFRRIIDFLLKIFNVILSFINRVFSKVKYSKSNDIVMDLNSLDKSLALVGKFLLVYGVISGIISVIRGNIIMFAVMITISLIGIVLASSKSMEYFRNSLIYRILTYFVSFRSKEWN
jgi:hypothetical protein